MRPRLYPFCKDWFEAINPPTDSFMGYINAACCHYFFNIAQAQIKSEIKPNNTLNHIRMEAATVVNGDFHHK